MTDPQGISSQALYPNLRWSLSPEYGHLSDSDLESVFEAAFGEGVSPAEYEEFFGGLGRAISSVARDVGHVAQQAAPVIATIGSGALQGAMTGSALGPYGAIAGAVAGGVGSGLSHYGKGPVRQIGSGIGTALGAAGALTGRSGMTGAGLAGGGTAGSLGSLLGSLGGAARGSGAASSLLAMLQRPETLTALRSLAGGGRQGVPVGRTGMAVPASSFASLIGALAHESVAEGTEFGEEEPINAAVWSPEILLQVLQTLPQVEQPRYRQPQYRMVGESDPDEMPDDALPDDAEEMFFFESDDGGFSSSFDRFVSWSR